MTKRMLAALLTLLLPLFCAAAEEAPAVRVGDVSYSAQTVQFSLTAAMDLYAAQGRTLDEAERQQLLEETLDRFVGLGLIENKLRETGDDAFSDVEEQRMRTLAQSSYEEMWQSLYHQLLEAGEDVTEQDVTQWLTQQGYTLDAYYQEALAAARYERILAQYCADVTVGQPQVLAHYLTVFVEPDQARYQHNIPLYEQEILHTGSEAFYVPEGYRYIKHILLPFPEDIMTELNAIDRRIEAAEAERQTAYDDLAQAAAGGLDIAPYKAAYDEKVAAIESLVSDSEQAMAKALPALEEKTDHIAQRLSRGESFETLMSEYSSDSTLQSPDEPGMLFHPQSESWAERFRQAAASLSQPGDVSRPVVTTAGVHIIRYMADAPGGVHVLNAQEQAALEQSALHAAQLEKLNALMLDWREDYAVTTDSSLLSVQLP